MHEQNEKGKIKKSRSAHRVFSNTGAEKSLQNWTKSKTFLTKKQLHLRHVYQLCMSFVVEFINIY